MAKQSVIVLDNPPLPRDGWADQVFALAKCTRVENEAIARQMSQDEEAKPDLLKYAGDPVRNAEHLAPHYKRALEVVHGKDARLGLYGTAWVVYTEPIDAVVVDWSAVEKVATDPKNPPGTGDRLRTESQTFVRGRVKQHVKPERVLELPPGLSPEEKVTRSMAFLKKLGLV